MSLRKRGLIRNIFRWSGLLLLGMVIGGAAGFGYHLWQMGMTEKVEPIVKQAVLTVNRPIAMGEVITEEDIMEMEIEEENIPLGSFTNVEEVVGKKTWARLTPKAVLHEDYFFQESLEFLQNTQELELNKLPERLEQGDYVDVRIHFPSGHDYCVVSHKQVGDLNIEQNKIMVGLSEEEIVRLGSAKADASTFDNSYLYLTIYPKGVDMPQTIVRYPVNGSVQGLYEDVAHSNIISDERNQLELALEQLKQEEKFLKSTATPKSEKPENKTKEDTPMAEDSTDKNLEKYKEQTTIKEEASPSSVDSSPVTKTGKSVDSKEEKASLQKEKEKGSSQEKGTKELF